MCSEGTCSGLELGNRKIAAFVKGKVDDFVVVTDADAIATDERAVAGIHAGGRGELLRRQQVERTRGNVKCGDAHGDGCAVGGLKGPFNVADAFNFKARGDALNLGVGDWAEAVDEVERVVGQRDGTTRIQNDGLVV